MDKLKAVFVFIGTLNVQALLVGVLSLAILIFWPMLPGFLKRIPASLIAVIAGSAAVTGLHLNVNTIGICMKFLISCRRFRFRRSP